jgi:hypothetical protein
VERKIKNKREEMTKGIYKVMEGRNLMEWIWTNLKFWTVRTRAS